MSAVYENPVLVSEASTRFCPVSLGGHAGASRCMGPDCMGWRCNDRQKGTGYCGMAGQIFTAAELVSQIKRVMS